MKTVFTIEDTPQGLTVGFLWEGNDYQDNPADSVAMAVQTNLMLMVKDMEEKGLLRVVKRQPSVAT